MTAWLETSTKLFFDSMNRLTDTEFDAPTALSGWSRRHLLAHVASNADALDRLTRWARTGVRTPMYASPVQRAADIEAGALRTPGELRAEVYASAGRLATGFRALPDSAWAAEVVTAQGRTVPAAQVPWMRTREVAVHAVDLDAGTSFRDLPAGLCHALIDDIVQWRAGKGNGPALVLSDGGRTWTIPGTGGPGRVELATPDLAAWLAGRFRSPELPVIPRWL
jgi:maleylpyruvate isomerase